jgi:hypothetical protein
MVQIQLLAPTTSSRPDAPVPNRVRQIIWLSALVAQLYLGLDVIQEIETQIDTIRTFSVCGPQMTTLCTQFTIIVVLAVTVGLQAGFYWAWGTGWKECWVGRAAHWMWGPIEDTEIDVEKGEGSSSTIVDHPFEAPMPMILPIPNSTFTDVPFQAPKPMVLPVPSTYKVLASNRSRVSRLRPALSQTHVEFPRTKKSAPRTETYDSKREAVTAVYNYQNNRTLELMFLEPGNKYAYCV